MSVARETFSVRAAVAADREARIALRRRLWSDPSIDHEDDLRKFGERWPEACVVASDSSGTLIGFAELSLRSVVDGCETSPVGYLEGWYVEAAWRRRGVGRALVAAGEGWARAQGCSEFGSDVVAENAGSVAAHLRLGFAKQDVVVTFTKKLR